MRQSIVFRKPFPSRETNSRLISLRDCLIVVLKSAPPGSTTSIGLVLRLITMRPPHINILMIQAYMVKRMSIRPWEGRWLYWSFPSLEAINTCDTPCAIIMNDNKLKGLIVGVSNRQHNIITGLFRKARAYLLHILAVTDTPLPSLI